MSDVVVFKVEILTEGGYVTHAPKFSQFSETLDLASKRLVIQAEAWAKNLAAEIREQARLEMKGPQEKTPPRVVVTA